jgi:hypothetical protein
MKTENEGPLTQVVFKAGLTVQLLLEENVHVYC